MLFYYKFIFRIHRNRPTFRLFWNFVKRSIRAIVVSVCLLDTLIASHVQIFKFIRHMNKITWRIIFLSIIIRM